MGAALSRLLAARGARLALLDVDGDRLAALATECGGDAAWWTVDITDAEQLAAAAAGVADRFGRLDALVANAGVLSVGPLLSADPAGFERTIEVNLLGSVRTVRAFLPALVASRGYVLQVGSVAALLAPAGLSAYSAGKAGAETFAHCLRDELAPQGIDVGVAYLSWTDTAMVRSVADDPVIRALRASAPAPFRRLVRAPAAAAALAAGIERRAARVYVPGWVRLLPWLRPVLPGVVAGPRRREDLSASL